MSERAVELVANLVRSHKVDGRRSYDRQAKVELIRRCLEPGVSVAGAALTHGLNANLLRKYGSRMRRYVARSSARHCPRRRSCWR